MLNILEAQRRAEGWGLIAAIDQGADFNHSELKSRSASGSTAGTLVAGGSVLPYFSQNMVIISGEDPATKSRNLQEDQPQRETTLTDACDLLDNANDDNIRPKLFGHGTHVVGLVAANGMDSADGATNIGVRGTCLRCGVQVIRAAEVGCVESVPETNYRQLVEHVANGTGQAIRNGAQIINMSFGYASDPPACTPTSNDLICKQLEVARQRDVLVVAASGNHLTRVQFPASEPDVVAVGGLTRYVVDHESGIWNDSTDNAFAGCPFESTPSRRECGSNYSTSLTERQEIVTPAKEVVSTFPLNANWSDIEKIPCGDNEATTTDGDSLGPCTGTSMSAPIAAGIYGIVRSINPLVRVGDPFDGPDSPQDKGVRDVIVDTSSRKTMPPPPLRTWHVKYGWGFPDANLAVMKMLGSSNGLQLENRAIPLFRLYQPDLSDYAAVATPQLAMSLALDQTSKYVTQGGSFIEGQPIPGYATFPSGSVLPRALALIHSTPGLSRLSPVKRSIPLHLLDTCETVTSSCASRDFVLVTSQTAITNGLNAGYRYAGLQGYVVPPCSPEATCKPPGSVSLWLQCKTGAGSDCAVFTGSEKGAFESAGYTNLFQGTPALLGFAWPIADADNDQLPDAAEMLIGTSPTTPHSDADSQPDGAEYPFAGVPVDDPCTWPRPAGHACAIPEPVFKNGFE